MNSQAPGDEEPLLKPPGLTWGTGAQGQVGLLLRPVFLILRVF